MIRLLIAALALPGLAAAQVLPITHISSGLDATSARTRIERAGPRQFGPKAEAGAFLTASGPVIRVVKPSFRLPAQDLGIAEAYDVLFFGTARLVRLRVHLRAAGEPVAERWTAQLRKYFEFLDRDGNGILNRYEAEFAFNNPSVGQMLQSGFAYQRPDDTARLFAELDVDADGRASFDEFAAYYTPSAARIVSATPNPTRDVYADSLTDELFKLFDTDKDGRLSRPELTAVEGLFATLDADEDECLSAPEVAPPVFTTRTFPRPDPPVPLPTKSAGPSPMMVFTPTTIPDSIGDTILKRYAADGKWSLGKAKGPFGDDLFRTLDANDDGELSAAELARWKDTEPDLELEMTLGTKPGESAIQVRPRADGKPVPLAAAFRLAAEGTAIVTVGSQAIQLSCYTPRGVYADPRRSRVLQFPQTKSGYVSEGDIAGPQYQSLRVLFDMIDRDADGRMSRAEFDAFVALQQSFTRLPLSLVHSAQTPSLFQVLDENGDGRLSVREVRTAWARLIALEPVEKDYVTRAALQPQGAVKFGRSREVFTSNPTNMYTMPPVRQTTKGPLWFRKFDRNGDGEVSAGEFPGAREQFNRLDADRDGYITAVEAEAADRRERKK